jgi:predicted transcriptional regulator
VGKGQRVKLEKMLAKAFINSKNAIESFNEHARHEFHLAATTRAQNFISVFENKTKDIFERLDSGRKAQALQNRAKLNPIVKTATFVVAKVFLSGVILTRER